MNEKEPIRIKLSTVILLFIIFILIIAMIFMFLYFNNFQHTKQNEINANLTNKSTIYSSNDSDNVESSQPQDNISTPTSLNIESSEVKQLYNYIMKVNTNQEKLVYRNTKVTEKDLNNQLKLITIFKNVSKNDVSETKSVTDEYGYTTEHTYYKKEKIENIAKKIFGNNVSITHESCEAYLTQAIDFKNGEYDCYEYQGGGDTPWEMSTSEIISAEQKGNELYIYDKYVHIYGNASSSNYDIYDSSDKSLKIAENVSLNKIVNNASSSSGTYSSKAIINNLETITNNKIKTFKHTFKKNSDGTYYWYSSEPIN